MPFSVPLLSLSYKMLPFHPKMSLRKNREFFLPCQILTDNRKKQRLTARQSKRKEPEADSRLLAEADSRLLALKYKILSEQLIDKNHNASDFPVSFFCFYQRTSFSC